MQYLYAEDAPRWVKENGAKSEDEAVALEKREELLDIELEQTRHEILAVRKYLTMHDPCSMFIHKLFICSSGKILSVQNQSGN